MKQLIPMDDYGIFCDSKDTARTDELVAKALSMAGDDLSRSLKLVDKAFQNSGPSWIEHCVRETVIRWHMLSQPTEKDVYDWFRSNFKKLLGDSWKIVRRKNDSKNIPDFWLSDGHEFVPVECKLHKFDSHALRQLERYIRHYKCNSGLAVAESLEIELPAHIGFIQVKLNGIKDESLTALG